MRRRILSAALSCAILFSLGGGFAGATDPGPSQLASWAQACAAVGEGELSFSNGTPTQCTSLPDRMLTWTDFTGNFNSSGCPSGNPMPIWSQMLACAITSTTVQQLTDPWLISGTTYWPITGSGTFVADSSELSGEPVGAQSFQSPAGSAGTTSIIQQILPTTIASTTPLVVRAYLSRQSVTVGGNSDGCTGGSVGNATGTAEVEIVNSSGAVINTPIEATAAGFQLYASATTFVGATGSYYVKVILTTTQASGVVAISDPLPSPHCVTNSVSSLATASAIDVTIGNS
jgi:hypothetical protein